MPNDKNMSADALMEMKRTLLNWKELMIGAAQKHFERDGTLAPVILGLDYDVYTQKFDMVFMPMIMKNEEDKDFMAEAARQLCTERNIVALMIIHEAWMATVPPDTDLSHTTASNHPERQEVVLVLFETKLSNDITTYLINRDGPKPTLSKMNYEEIAAPLVGRFVNLLKMEIPMN